MKNLFKILLLGALFLPHINYAQNPSFEEQKITLVPGSLISYKQIKLLDNGNYIITYTNNNAIEIRFFNADHEILNTHNFTAIYSHKPQLSVDGNGNILVYYQDANVQGAVFIKKVFNREGALLNTHFLKEFPDPYQGRAPFSYTFEHLQNGSNLICGYGKHESQDPSLKLEFRNDNGQALSDPITILADDFNNDWSFIGLSKAIEFNNGNIMVFWTENNSAQNTRRIYAKVVRNDGTVIKDRFQVILDNNDNEIIYGVDGNGTFAVLAWDKLNNGSRDVYSRRIDDNGNFIEDPQLVSAPEIIADKRHPEVTVNAAGNYMITWKRLSDQNNDIYYSSFLQNGEVLESAKKVNLTTSLEDGIFLTKNLPIDMNAEGEAYIAWEADNQISYRYLNFNLNNTLPDIFTLFDTQVQNNDNEIYYAISGIKDGINFNIRYDRQNGYRLNEYDLIINDPIPIRENISIDQNVNPNILQLSKIKIFEDGSFLLLRNRHLGWYDDDFRLLDSYELPAQAAITSIDVAINENNEGVLLYHELVGNSARQLKIVRFLLDEDNHQINLEDNVPESIYNSFFELDFLYNHIAIDNDGNIMCVYQLEGAFDDPSIQFVVIPFDWGIGDDFPISRTIYREDQNTLWSRLHEVKFNPFSNSFIVHASIRRNGEGALSDFFEISLEAPQNIIEYSLTRNRVQERSQSKFDIDKLGNMVFLTNSFDVNANYEIFIFNEGKFFPIGDGSVSQEQLDMAGTNNNMRSVSIENGKIDIVYLHNSNGNLTYRDMGKKLLYIDSRPILTYESRARVNENAGNAFLLYHNNNLQNVSSYTHDGIGNLTFEVLNDMPFAVVPDVLQKTYRLRTVGALNHEEKDTYDVSVKITDENGNFSIANYHVIVNDVNDRPSGLVRTIFSLPSGSPVGTDIGELEALDEDGGDNHVFEVRGNADFRVVNGTILELVNPNLNVGSYNVTIRITDSGNLTRDVVITVNLFPRNDHAPTKINLSNNKINENLPKGTLIGVLSVLDNDLPNDAHRYEIVSIEGIPIDQIQVQFRAFAIVQNGNNFELRSGAVFNKEVKDRFNVVIDVFDQGNETFRSSFNILINNVNEAPTNIIMEGGEVSVLAGVDDVVASFSTVDPEDPNGQAAYVYNLVDDPSGRFAINGNNLIIRNVANLNVGDQFIVRVRTSDGALFYAKSFTIRVTESVAPSDINAVVIVNSVDENVADINVLSFSTVDPDGGDTHVYSIISVNDRNGNALNGYFRLQGNVLRTFGGVNYEEAQEAIVRIRTTDRSGRFYEEDFVVVINDANDLPFNIQLTNTEIAANMPNGDLVARISAEDEDNLDLPGINRAHQDIDFEFAANAPRFEIVDDRLILRDNAGLNNGDQLQIRINAIDSQGGRAAAPTNFVINVTAPSANAPTNITLDNASVNENSAINSLVGTLGTVDPDAGDSHTYSIITPNVPFTIVGDKLRITAVLNHEVRAVYRLTIETRDNGGLTFRKEFDISVNDINEAPSNMNLNVNNIAFDTAVGTNLGQFSTTDEDEGDNHTYTFVNEQGFDNNLFQIVNGNVLRLAVSVNGVAGGQVRIKVKSTDSGNLTFSKAFTISVVGDNQHAPTNISLSSESVRENLAVGTVVGELSTTDQDAGDSHTYQILTQDVPFAIDGENLITTARLNHEQTASYQVEISTEDETGLIFRKIFTIQVADANDVPTALVFNVDQIAYETPVGTLIGLLITEDEDENDVYVYEFVDEQGLNNDKFTIADGNKLLLAVSLENFLGGVLRIKIKSTDSGGETIVEEFELEVVQQVLGIDQVDKETLKVYPNPTSSLIYVEMGNEHVGVIDEFMMYNAKGQRINMKYERSGNNLLVDMNDHVSGMYVLHLRIRNKHLTKRIVKR